MLLSYELTPSLRLLLAIMNTFLPSYNRTNHVFFGALTQGDQLWLVICHFRFANIVVVHILKTLDCVY